jgi:hypothetical protein
MTDASHEILEILEEIRNLLKPISACFDEEYREVRAREQEVRVQRFRRLLTPRRRRIYPLLFDPRRLSQVEIAREADTKQPTVSRFVSALLKSELVQERTDSSGNRVYVDRYDLRKVAEEKHGQE